MIKSLWNEKEAQIVNHDPVAQRVYSSRLLGQEPALVMHGGGNTSVKTQSTDILGETHEVLYVKGSGWDLATIEAEGFAPVRLKPLLKMAQFNELSDADMVHLQRAAMLNPNAPNPSVEAILHAIIPFQFVDHTHADAVLAVSHSPQGDDIINDLYGDRVLVIPYVMPGFSLARAIYQHTRDIDWSQYEGMILLHHGVFSWGDDARTSYERMIDLVVISEEYLTKQEALQQQALSTGAEEDLLQLAELRKSVSTLRGGPVLAKWDGSPESRGFSEIPGIVSVANNGPLTPDHVIRTKPRPLQIKEDLQESLSEFTQDYQEYFQRHSNGEQTCLDLAPRWAIWPGYGTVAFGRSNKEATIIADINRHTRAAIQWSKHLGGWHPIPEADTFAMEYWELEQAKLKRKGTPPLFQGTIALVTGAASGIGRACVASLQAQGCVVAALDIAPDLHTIVGGDDILPIHCDVTDLVAVEAAVKATVRAFGGLDLVVSNAGNFPPSRSIAEMDNALWENSLQLNLSSHQKLLTAAIPFLARGVKPSVVLVGSKNVPAPGPGAAAYSVAKAGLTQLSRVAALELGQHGIRVNVVHPNAVFDTGIWKPDVLKERARRYNLTVEEYQTNNILHTNVTSADVAGVVSALLSPTFAKTTGAQIAVDGGNERVI